MIVRRDAHIHLLEVVEETGPWGESEKNDEKKRFERTACNLKHTTGD